MHAGHDLVRRARHLLQRPARARGRSPDRRRRQAAGRAQAARVRAQAHADDRPLARHPCRADHVRPQARLRLRRVRARTRAPPRRAQGDRDLRDLGRGRHLRAGRPAGRGARGEGARARGRAGVDAGDRARPPRHVFRDARRRRRLGRAARDRDPPPAAHRGGRSRGVLLGGAEGLLRHAAQAQPGADREPHRARAHGARLCDAGAGECRALARARHLAFLGRAHDRAGRDGDARLRARAARLGDRQARRLPRCHAPEPRPARAASCIRSAC